MPQYLEIAFKSIRYDEVLDIHYGSEFATVTVRYFDHIIQYEVYADGNVYEIC